MLRTQGANNVRSYRRPAAPPNTAQGMFKMGWFKTIGGGLFLLSFVGVISDVLQPIVFATTFVIVATTLVFLILLGIRIALASASEHTATKMLDPVIAAIAIVCVSSIGLKMWQSFVPHGNEFGILGATYENVRAIQNSLRGVRQDIRSVGRQIDGIGEKVTGIDRKIDAVNNDNSPEVVARRNIVNAGYPVNNKGYLRAIAEGNSMENEYRTLGVKGGKEELEEELLVSPIGSREFKHLLMFLNQAPSRHYAATVRTELVSFMRRIYDSKSTTPIKKIACRPSGNSFIEKFVRYNFAKLCNNDKEFLEKIASFGSECFLILDSSSKEHTWWYRLSNYPELIKHIPSAPRTISFSQFQRALTDPDRQNLLGEYVIVEVELSLQETISDFTYVHIFSPTTHEYVGQFRYEDTKIMQQPCMTITRNRARCAAQLTLHITESSLLPIIMINNIRAL